MLRRTADNMIIMHARDDIVNSVESLQVFAGHGAGCESLIDAICAIYKELPTEASNTCSSANRNAFLHNAKVIFPSIVR